MSKYSTISKIRESVGKAADFNGWEVGMTDDVFKQVILHFNFSPPYDNYAIVKDQLNIFDDWRG